MSAGDPSPYRLQNVRAAAGHYLLGRGAGAIAGLAAAVLLVRHMQVWDYAGYTAIMGIAGIVAMLAWLGVDRVVTRFVPEAHLFHGNRGLANFVWRLLAARLLATGFITTCLAATWPWVMSWFDFIALRSIPLSLAVYMVAAATTQLLVTVLQALVRQRLLTRINLLQWGGRLLWIVLLVQQGGNISLQQVLWIFALPEVAGATVMLLAAAFILRPSATANSGPLAAGAWRPRWNEVRHLAGHSYGFSILSSLPQGYFMRTLVAATLPVETVAAYGFFSNLIDRLRNYLPMQLMYGLVEPVMVVRYLRSNDTASLIRDGQFIYKLNVFILVAVMIFFAISGPELWDLVVRGQFPVQMWILLLLLFQVIIGSHVLVIQLILNVLKANRLMSKASLSALLVMLIFLALPIVAKQESLILYGVLIYEITINLALFWGMHRNGIRYQFPISEIGKIVVSGVMLVLGAHQMTDHLNLQKLPQVVGVAGIGVFLYVLICVALDWIDVTRMKSLARER